MIGHSTGISAGRVFAEVCRGAVGMLLQSFRAFKVCSEAILGLSLSVKNTHFTSLHHMGLVATSLVCHQVGGCIKVRTIKHVAKPQIREGGK